MLEKIGVKNFEELLKPIPSAIQMKSPLDLPAPLPEMELLREMEEISLKNKTGLVIFAGGGVYDHFIPSALGTILSRPEFVTAYTPYQAEVVLAHAPALEVSSEAPLRRTGLRDENDPRHKISAREQTCYDGKPGGKLYGETNELAIFEFGITAPTRNEPGCNCQKPAAEDLQGAGQDVRQRVIRRLEKRRTLDRRAEAPTDERPGD